MKSSVKEVLESIPDFDDFLKLADEIGDLSFKKMQMDNVIKTKEATIVATAMTDVKYFVSGKQPSMSFIENTYKQVGFDGELINDRSILADITATLEKRKIQLSIYRDMLEVFRTLSANERVQVI